MAIEYVSFSKDVERLDEIVDKFKDGFEGMDKLKLRIVCDMFDELGLDIILKTEPDLSGFIRRVNSHTDLDYLREYVTDVFHECRYTRSLEFVNKSRKLLPPSDYFRFSLSPCHTTNEWRLIGDKPYEVIKEPAFTYYVDGTHFAIVAYKCDWINSIYPVLARKVDNKWLIPTSGEYHYPREEIAWDTIADGDEASIGFESLIHRYINHNKIELDSDNCILKYAGTVVVSVFLRGDILSRKVGVLA